MKLHVSTSQLAQWAGLNRRDVINWGKRDLIPYVMIDGQRRYGRRSCLIALAMGTIRQAVDTDGCQQWGLVAYAESLKRRTADDLSAKRVRIFVSRGVWLDIPGPTERQLDELESLLSAGDERTKVRRYIDGRRSELGLTLADIARRAHYSESHVINVLAGRHRGTEQFWRLVGQGLDCSPDHLRSLAEVA